MVCCTCSSTSPQTDYRSAKTENLEKLRHWCGPTAVLQPYRIEIRATVFDMRQECRVAVSSMPDGLRKRREEYR